MFCPKCGTQVDDSEKVCSNCGFNFEGIELSETADNKADTVSTRIPGTGSTSIISPTSNTTSKKDSSNSMLSIVLYIIAAVVLILSFVAASSISKGGNQIMQIESVGGETLEEAYYQYLGDVYTGFAMLSRTMGIFFATILFYLGIKSRK